MTLALTAMQALRWKSLSGLDGSERTFGERLRTPDASFPRLLMALSIFLPIGFGILMIPFMVLPLLADAFLGPQSWIADWLYAVSTFVLKLGTYMLVLTFFGMYGLRGYVALKLRRQKGVQ
jgi:hypothetical protein